MSKPLLRKGIAALERNKAAEKQANAQQSGADRDLTFDELFRDEGPYRRELYPNHVAFFSGGSLDPERCFMAGNRVGKTLAGAYEMTCHLTGLYPHWWTGKRFDHPVTAWAAGETHQTVRDVVQKKLLSIPYGTGVIPGKLIVKATHRAQPAGAVDTVSVKHVSGGISQLIFKSYDQKRTSFAGTAMHVIWLDEEPSQEIYHECLARLMTTKGILFLTYTPIKGLTPLTLRFLPQLRI